MNRTIINSLYDHYKNTNKKLKIVCDWDEVIQTTEPYSLWLTIMEQEVKKEVEKKEGQAIVNFKYWFKDFWSKDEENWWEMNYSPAGSELKINHQKESWEELKVKSSDLKNSPNFYQQAPFLTIAEDLLKLIKEDKIEKLIFLSTSDERKIEVFKETFGKLDKTVDKEWGEVVHKIILRILTETQYKTKADWIKQHAPSFDIFIDDDPNICKSVLNEFVSFGLCRDCRNNRKEKEIWDIKGCARCPKEFTTVLSPHYPAIANQHDERVLLVKQEVSDLKKEDFSK